VGCRKTNSTNYEGVVIMTVELRPHSGEGISALPCSPQELEAHILPSLEVRACKILLRAVESAPHIMLTLCFQPKPTHPDKMLSAFDWEYQGLRSMTEGELKALSRSHPRIRRLYATRKEWLALLNQRLSELH
jgi:hypothetical protein